MISSPRISGRKKGQSTLEYVIILACIGVAAAFVISHMGHRQRVVFSDTHEMTVNPVKSTP